MRLSLPVFLAVSGSGNAGPVREAREEAMRGRAETAEAQAVFFRQQGQAARREQADVAIARRRVPPVQAPLRRDVAVAGQRGEQDQAFVIHQETQVGHERVGVRYVLEHLERRDQVEFAERRRRRAIPGEGIVAGRIPSLLRQDAAQAAIAAAIEPVPRC